MILFEKTVPIVKNRNIGSKTTKKFVLKVNSSLDMFCSDFTKLSSIETTINDNSDQNESKSESFKKKSAKRRRETRLERQKQNRYEVIRKLRFPDSQWNGFSDGYESEDNKSNESNSPNKMSESKGINDLLFTHSLPQYESELNDTIDSLLRSIEDNNMNDYDFGTHTDVDHNLFEVNFLNKMSTIIGSEVRLNLQVKIMQLFEESVRDKELNNNCTQNLINSQLIPKLIHSIGCGDEKVVKQSLKTIRQLIESSVELSEYKPSNDLLIHLLNMGFITSLTARANLLKWKKSSKSSFGGLRPTSDKQSVSADMSTNKSNFSDVSKQLFRFISHAVTQLMYLQLNDKFKYELIIHLSPLLHKSLLCPDPQVQCNAIHSLSALDSNFVLLVIESFGQTLFAMTSNASKDVVLSVMQLFHKMLDSNAQLISYKDFVFKLITCLESLLTKSPECKLIKEILDIIAMIGENVSTTDANSQQSLICNQLLYLSTITFMSNNRNNRLKAISVFTTVLHNYSLKQFVIFYKSFDLINFLRQCLHPNDNEYQKLGLELISHILSLFNCSDVKSSEEELVKCHLFGEQTDIRYYLEKLSYKTNNDYVSSRANQLINELTAPQTGADDLNVLPQTNGSYYVFATNSNASNFAFN